MIAGPRQTRHLEPAATTSTARDDRSHLDHVGVVETRVAGCERAVANHEVRLTVQAEAVEQLVDRARPRQLDLALRLPQLHDHQETLGQAAERRRLRRDLGVNVRMPITCPPPLSTATSMISGLRPK